MSQSLRKIPEALMSTEVDGELVMIHGDSGNFFALKDVGLEIWKLLDEHSDLDEICKSLRQNYDVAADECAQSTRAFADQLVKAGFAEYC